MSRSPFFVALGLALAGCGTPPPTPPQPQAVTVGLPTEPWVGTQTPSGPYTTASTRQPYQTPNSLPPGAASGPIR